MTRKHFARLAQVVCALRDSPTAKLTDDQIEEISDQLALACTEFNPDFKVQLFFAACGRG